MRQPVIATLFENPFTVITRSAISGSDAGDILLTPRPCPASAVIVLSPIQLQRERQG